MGVGLGLPVQVRGAAEQDHGGTGSLQEHFEIHCDLRDEGQGEGQGRVSRGLGEGQA